MAPHLDLLPRPVTGLTAPSYTRGLPNAMGLTPDDAIALARLGALEALLFGSTLIGEHFVHMDAGLPELAKLTATNRVAARLWEHAA